MGAIRVFPIRTAWSPGLSPTRRHLVTRLAALAPAYAILGASDVFAQAVPTPENMFISPCGQPFRAPPEAPYPVVDWFKQADKNADGHLDRDEFNADAEAFFKILDINRDGFLSPYEIAVYERKIVPEIGGPRLDAALDQAPRLWLAQFGGQGGMGGMGGMGGQGGGGHMGGGSPSGQQPPSQSPQPNTDESHQGAAPFSFFDEPEPVTAADLHYRGIVAKADFLVLSNAHFDMLDRDQKGYLTLDALPYTPVQKRLLKRKHRR
jgi:hypothetical protein